jgi:hypothetical protein
MTGRSVQESQRHLRNLKVIPMTEVMKENTWGSRTSAPWAITNNWYYLYNLGKMLPDREQCNLCICKGYHHSKPEANQIRMDSALYSERAEYNERKACILCSSPTGLCEGRCGSLPTQERWQSKPDLIQLLTFST